MNPTSELARIAQAARERRSARHTSATARRRADGRTRSAADAGGSTIRLCGRGRRPEHVGHHSGRRTRQPHPAARLLEGAAAGRQPPRERRASGPARSASTCVERMVAAGADKICFVISPGKSDILEYYGAELRPGGHRLCRAAASRAGCATRSSARAADRAGTSRWWSGCPTRSGFPRTRSPRCPTTARPSCCSRSSGRELFDAVVIDETGRVPEIQVKQPRRRTQLDLGRVQDARRGPARAASALASARPRRRVSRHAGQCLARRGRRGLWRQGRHAPTSTSARSTATARRSACSTGGDGGSAARR